MGIGRQKYLDDGDWVAAAFDVERLKRLVLDRWVVVTRCWVQVSLFVQRWMLGIGEDEDADVGTNLHRS